MLTESMVRNKARRMGYRLKKSRQLKHVPHGDNFGDYMLVTESNWVVLGERFDATLEDIWNFLAKEAKREK